MASFLLTWNPRAWDWTDLDECLRDTLNGQEIKMRWSVGVTKRIKPNDQALLMRLGEEPKGVIGYGRFASETFTDEHWSGEKGRVSRYAKVNFLILLPEKKIIPLALLKQEFPEQNWTPQASGQSLEDAVAEQLIQLLLRQTKKLSSPKRPAFLEGAMQRVVSDRRERSQEARNECIRHWGLNCVLCDFNFEKTYGVNGQGFIHVHHLKPLGESQEEREVDPIRDLVPVCANCHAIIHRRKEPFALTEMRKMMGK